MLRYGFRLIFRLEYERLFDGEEIISEVLHSIESLQYAVHVASVAQVSETLLPKILHCLLLFRLIPIRFGLDSALEGLKLLLLIN